jgi:3-oxoacyl-[acyl-carrier-protein] synthase-3
MNARAVNLNARLGLDYSVEIVATGYSLPSDQGDNETVLSRCQFDISEDPEALADETRVKSRPWCAAGETPWTMARDAVRMILERQPELAGEIDVVLVASGTSMPIVHPPEPDNPGQADLAPLVLRELGRSDALGLDLKACYCSGFHRGLQVMDSLLGNPNYSTGLVIATEWGSRFATAPSNRSTFCFIMADAAGAWVLRKRPLQPGVGVLDHYGFTDAGRFSLVGIGGDGVSNVMRGQSAGEAVHRLLVQSARALLERNGLTADDVDWLLPIQTHAGVVEGLRAALGWPAEKLYWRGDVLGFSGSASVPSALSEALHTGRIKPGQLVLSVAVGAGLNCGGTLYRV